MPSRQSGLFKIVRIKKQQGISAQCTYMVKKNYRKAIEGFGRAGRSAKGLRPSAVNKNLLA